MCGTITLQVLTDYLCDSTTSIKTLKEIFRSITVHWILLLFRFQESEVVVNCGIRLLTQIAQSVRYSYNKKILPIKSWIGCIDSVFERLVG